MARAKLDLPKRFVFSTEIPIRIGDINYGGHLGNDAVLSLIHEARVQFLKRHGFTESDVGGCGLIMSDATVVYTSQAFYGETLRIEIAAGEFIRCGCDLFYRLCDVAGGREVALAKTGVVFFDYGNQRPVRVPDGFRAITDPGEPP